jgi:hypothetical protein
MITDENSTTDELFQKHDVALRAFILTSRARSFRDADAGPSSGQGMTICG